MSNTVIQLKWSEVTSTPVTLNVAEPAYSNNSNKLFIGLAGNQVIAIGGKYYTDLVDAATSSNTVSTIVKRDSAGGFAATHVYASLFGNANTATTAAAWTTARTIGVDGDATGTVSISGSANANIPLTLGNSGVTAASYGSATAIPVITVDAKGRLTTVTTAAISTTLNTAGDSGTDAVALASDTLTFKGAEGITTNMVSANTTLMIDVDSTVLRTTGGTISGDLAVTGNLIISGDTITQNVSTILTEDSLIHLGSNNAGDALDIGFFGEYTSTGKKFAGLFRDASDSGKFKLMVDGTEQPSAGNTVNTAAFTRGTLDTSIVGGSVTGLSAAILVADGGTGAATFSAGRLLVGNGTSAIQALANTGTAGTYGSATQTAVITTDVYGRVSAATTTAIAGLNTSVLTAGILPLARGGTNNDTFTSGTITFYNGTALASLANTGTAGTYGSAADTAVITTDAYGRVSGATTTPIALAASQITSGTLLTTRGGTGLTSFTSKGVFFAGSTSAISQATSSTEGHLLTINASGTPEFAHLSGGSF